MNRPAHFEISSSDVNRTIDFYEQVFGWSVRQWGDQEYWMVTTGTDDDTPGINGAITPRRGDLPRADTPTNGFVVTMAVDDLDTTIESALKMGGEIRVPKMPIPEVGWMSYLADPDGNMLGVLQPDMAMV